MIDQGELFSIPSPCQGICEVNNRGYCKGCLRNRTERFHWLEFTAYQQQLIINNCEKRRQKIIASRNAIDVEEELDIPQFDLFTSRAELRLAVDKPDVVSSALVAETNAEAEKAEETTAEEEIKSEEEDAPPNSLFAESVDVTAPKESTTSDDKKAEKPAKTQRNSTNQPPDSDQLDMFS
ncbi:DUF1289 domain-containing protein [Thalassolituus sp.]|jgi:predicted Fe-S protein YdhL (DUF1289 family)|uniref:DUF1289 domain-containing protein n=1 Tax=Thalassolituus sp. TaxID=2030822 RepID=UPI002A839AB7|nr:DUF1289 domain-containing protein [Thalassolituus sp.]